MSKLILHVGTHKTGTTSAQDTLALNRALLERNGVIFPKIGQTNGQHGLVTDWIKLPKPYHISTSATDAWKMLGKDHGKSDRTVLISTEELSRGNPEMRVDMVRLRELCSAFDEVRIICFLRNQAAFIQSIYLQVVKSGVHLPWNPFFNRAIRERMATGLYLDYSDLRRYFETGFSPDEIRFFSYEQACREEHGVIGRILVEAGHEALISLLHNLPNGQSNVSPDPLMTWVASRILADKPLEPWLIEAGRQVLSENLRPKVKTTVFTKQEHSMLVNAFRERNLAFEKAEQTIGQLVKIGPFFDGNDIFFRNELNQDFWIRLARKLHGRTHSEKQI